MNKVIICGRLGQDPELKHTPSGQAVCNLSVATSKKWKNDKGEAMEKTEWHRIIVWGKSGENCSKYLAKGREVLLEGELQTRSWEKDNVTHYITEIVAQNVQFIGSGGQGGGQGGGGGQQRPSGNPRQNQGQQPNRGSQQKAPPAHTFDEVTSPYNSGDLDNIPF